jgi:hypothetical protein
LIDSLDESNALKWSTGAAMNKRLITIPEGLRFADLQLQREAVTNRLLYRRETLEVLERANGLEEATMLDKEDLAVWLIAEWYLAYRSAGGLPDVVAEQVLAEVSSLQKARIPDIDP